MGLLKRYALAFEALFEVALASALTRLSARRYFRFYGLEACGGPAAERSNGAVPAPPPEIAVLGRAVARVARLVPFRAVCLQQSIATHRMLRRRGVGSVILFGILPAAHGANAGQQPLSLDFSRSTAHAWVLVEQAVVNGFRDDLDGFTVVASYR